MAPSRRHEALHEAAAPAQHVPARRAPPAARPSKSGGAARAQLMSHWADDGQTAQQIMDAGRELARAAMAAAEARAGELPWTEIHERAETLEDGERRARAAMAMAEEQARAAETHPDGAAADLAASAAATGKSIEARWAEEAVAAYDHGEPGALRSLPAAAQEQAIAGLQQLMAKSDDPARKLRLWRELYALQAASDARKPSDAPQERRNAAAADADHEAFAEATTLTMDAIWDGRMPSAEEVQALIERKQLEHDLEVKYGINLTNDGGARDDGSRIVWSKAELEVLDANLAQLPPEHVANNPALRDLRRIAKDDDGVGGFHQGGRVAVTDLGASLGPGFRHGGDARDLPFACSHCGQQVTSLDMVVTHEIGHNVELTTGAAADFRAVAGWRDESATSLAEAGVTREQLAHGKVRRDGRVYMLSRQGDAVQSVLGTAIPDQTEADAGAGSASGYTWGYAWASPKEHFAEHYAKAVQAPLKLYHDMVARPAEALEAQQADVKAREEALHALQERGAGDGEVQRAEQLLAKARSRLDVTEVKQEQRKKLYDLMRDRVFGAGAAEEDAVERLAARGISPERIERFKAAAQRVSTPAQVRAIEAMVK